MLVARGAEPDLHLASGETCAWVLEAGQFVRIECCRAGVIGSLFAFARDDARE